VNVVMNLRATHKVEFLDWLYSCWLLKENCFLEFIYSLAQFCLVYYPTKFYVLFFSNGHINHIYPIPGFEYILINFFCVQFFQFP
jgi:hypothetical protein